MSGLLRRLTRRRDATADETPESSESAAAPADTPAEAGGEQPVPASGEQPTQLIPRTDDQPAVEAQPSDATSGPQPSGAAPEPQPSDAGLPEVVTGEPVAVPGAAEPPQPPPVRDLPAGVDPGELEGAPAPSARRGKLRRRLRYLRRVRELLLRDLGGFTYEIQRTAGGIVRESHRRLIETKTGRLAALDAEVRDLETRLDEPHVQAVLREPGVGGTCPVCGELHSSDAHYCSRCGEPLDAKARAEREASIRALAQPTPPPHPAPEPKPASVLWAAGPRPATSAAHSEPAEGEASTATSEWLARGGQPTSKGAGERPATDEPAAAGDEPNRSTPSEAAADEADQVQADEAMADDEAAKSADEAGADDPVVAAPDETPASNEADETPAPAEANETGPRSDESDAADEGDSAGGAERRFEGGPNGRAERDADPRRVPGDPLGSRGDQRS
jgi:hypothetical protein